MIRTAGALIALVAIGWSLDLQTRAGTLIYAEQLVAFTAPMAAAMILGAEKVILVSDPFHMLRSIKMARDLGLIAYGSPTRSSCWRCSRPFCPSRRCPRRLRVRA